MNGKSCATIQNSFSAYLDGAVSGQEMQDISRHINGFEDGEKSFPGCEMCAKELAAWKASQAAVCSLGPAKAPADLALRLRVAMSREQARRESRLRDRLALAWENAVRPLAVQISAGFAGSVALIGTIVLLLGVVAAPQDVLANDEPIWTVTTPHFLYSTASDGAIVAPQDSVIVVEAAVDHMGRVYDFTILSGPKDPAVRGQIAAQLLDSVFEPANAFGIPIRGHAIITYSGISVRG